MKDKFREIITINGVYVPDAFTKENIASEIFEQAACECATLCDQFAVEFAEWKDLNSYPVTYREQKGFYMYDNSKHPGMLNLIDLYEIFKKQRDEN